MRELRCTRCGSSDLRLADGLILCNSCNAVFIPDVEEKETLSKSGPFRDGVNEKARKLLDRIYYDALDQHKALKTADKALEEAPGSAEAHWVRMQVLASHFKGYRQHDEENARKMVNGGLTALKYAKRLSMDEYRNYRHDVYEQMLETAVSQMSFSAEAMEDQSDLDKEETYYVEHERYQDETLQQYLERSDHFWLELHAGCFPAARILAQAVPDEILEEYPEFREKLREYVSCLLRDTDARQRRLGRYGQELLQEETKDRNEEITYQRERLEKMKI